MGLFGSSNVDEADEVNGDVEGEVEEVTEARDVLIGMQETANRKALDAREAAQARRQRKLTVEERLERLEERAGLTSVVDV